MFIINQENWEVVRNMNIIGSNRKGRVELINKGDMIIVYSIRPLSSIMGLFKVRSRKTENKKIFSGEIYPFRISLDPIYILEKPLKFKKLVGKLEFIKNKDRWNMYLFGVQGIRKLSKNDYNTIINAF